MGKTILLLQVAGFPAHPPPRRDPPGSTDRILATDSVVSLLRAGTRESDLNRWDEYRLDSLSFCEYVRILVQGRETPEETLARVPNAMDRFLKVEGAGSIDRPMAKEEVSRIMEDSAEAFRLP